MMIVVQCSVGNESIHIDLEDEHQSTDSQFFETVSFGSETYDTDSLLFFLSCYCFCFYGRGEGE